MMTYGSSNYLRLCLCLNKIAKAMAMIKRNRKGQQIVCQSFMKISLLSTPSVKLNSLGFNELQHLRVRCFCFKKTSQIIRATK
jgi:hypothetical protein